MEADFVPPCAFEDPVEAVGRWNASYVIAQDEGDVSRLVDVGFEVVMRSDGMWLLRREPILPRNGCNYVCALGRGVCEGTTLEELKEAFEHNVYRERG